MIKGFTEDTVMDYLSFACILISRKTVDEFGMLDENLTFYHEDCEYGMRLAASRHRVVYMVGARLIHLGGTSSIGASSFALENDVRGLLYLFGKYHPGLRFRWLKRALGTAFGWRIFFWHFGYYRHLRKFGLYEDKKRTVSREESLSILKKYKEIKRFIRQYEYR
jgi:GT2 family glycosyltransferase